jgi:translation initiation factor IF-1
VAAGAGRSVGGTVTAILPRALYRVSLAGGGGEVVAHAGSGPERNFVRLVVGDAVTVEVSARDATRGRIVRRGQSPAAGADRRGRR